MKKISRTFSIILTIAILFSFSACGNSASSSSVSGDGSEDVTITFWATPLISDFEDIFNNEFLPAFENEYPNIHVELEMMTFEGVSEKLQTAISTGTTPDVFLDGTARTASLPSLDILEPVDNIIGSFDDWYDTVLNIGVVNGVHYLVPATTIACSSLCVNATLAKELGIFDMLPKDKISWNIHDLYDFVHAAAEAGKDKDIFGTFLYAGSSTSDDIMYSLLLSNGGSIIDFDTMTCTANSPECVEVVETLGEMYKNGFSVNGSTMMTGVDSNTAFLNRQMVLSFNTSASASIVAQQKMVDEGYFEKVDEFRSYGVPTADGMKMDSASWGANCFAIFTNDNDKAKINAAKAMVKSFVDSKAMSEALWADAPTYTPVRDFGIVFSSDNKNLEEEVVLKAEWSGLYGDSSFGILESYWPEVRNCFYPELQAVYTGEKTAQEAMDSFAANVNAILANQK